MREIHIPLVVRLSLRQTDVHWEEEQLLAQRTELFRGVLEAVVAQIEAQAVEGARCQGVVDKRTYAGLRMPGRLGSASGCAVRNKEHPTRGRSFSSAMGPTGSTRCDGRTSPRR